MRTADLMLCYAIIAIAWQLACAWIQTFQSPWPLVDAFELADSAEEQLLKSLGIRFDAAIVYALFCGYLSVGRSLLLIRSVSRLIKALGSSKLKTCGEAPPVMSCRMNSRRHIVPNAIKDTALQGA